MRIRIISRLTLLALLLFGKADDVQGASPLWDVVGIGVEYREFFLPGPRHVYVARMDRSNPQVTLDTAIGQGRLSFGAETVRDMAARYDQAINYWGEEWGGRSQVIAAVNGFFFDTETGVPWSGQVQSGWYAKRFDERQTGSGFAWTLDRQAFIGGCVVHPPGKQYITHLSSEERLSFDALNVPRGENELIIYTPQYDFSTLTDDQGIEIVIEMDKPLLIIPEPEMVTGLVKMIRDGQGNSYIPFDHIVLSASGSAGDGLRKIISIGDRIGVSQEIRHLDPTCREPSPLDWTKTYAGIGGSFYFLRDGVVQGFDDLGALLHNPRTAIAYNGRYVFFIVVDGRNRLESLGMSIVDLAVFAKMTLGAVWGVALDGGGSSTMVINGELMNEPNVESEIVERVVANGLMMVSIQPMQTSSRFTAGDLVLLSEEINMRLGPGTNYGVLSVLSSGSLGAIQDHPMNGVQAKGYNWWLVSVGDIVGWVAEVFLNPNGEG